MKRLMMLLMAVMFVFMPLAYAGSNSGSNYSADCIPDGSGLCLDDPSLQILGIPSVASGDSRGPAPNSGDGVPDGSGFENPPSSGSGTSPGPAPNSGNGIPDGSGF